MDYEVFEMKKFRLKGEEENIMKYVTTLVSISPPLPEKKD